MIAGPISPRTVWIMKRLPKAIIWKIWKERNSILFEEETGQLHNLISDVQELLFSWSKSSGLFSGTSASSNGIAWSSNGLRFLGS